MTGTVEEIRNLRRADDIETKNMTPEEKIAWTHAKALPIMVLAKKIQAMQQGAKK